MALTIMSFQTKRLSSIFSLCLPLLLFLSSLPVVRKCSKPSLLSTWPKNVACCFLIFCTNDLLVSASFNTISFVFFAVHGMRNILLRNRLQSSLSLLVYRPCLTPVHQDRLDIALKGFLSRLERYVVVG